VGFFSDIGGFIMTPLYYAISAIMLAWHKLFTLIGLDADGGASWALSIIGLTLVIRVLLIPLFVKQIKASRNMQLIQPKVKELQKKYGHDRQLLAEKTMALYKDAGTNPFASCLPILLQMPIFFALFRLLDQAAKHGSDGGGRGFLSNELAEKFGNSKLWGHIPISESFWQARTWGSEGDASVMIMALILVLAMTATTFTTQRQLMSKNMPADAMTGPYAQQQKILLYILPVAFGLGGVAFPIGVLLYWTTSNLWTMGQQFYVIRNNPAPGTPAFAAKQKRDAAKGNKRGHEPAPADEVTVEEVPEEPRAAPRQQPKKKTRQQRKKGGPGPSAGQASPTGKATGKPTGKPTGKARPQGKTQSQGDSA
jgi:YidC/Oxa1 family membrane protein insertase